MLFFQKVQLAEMPERNDPLYVGHFFELPNMRWTKRRQRQEMIISIAIAWMRAMKKLAWAPGMIEEELMLTRLTKEVREARHIIEFFFTINRQGFNFGDGVNHSPTIVSPKKLPQKYLDAVEKYVNKISFDPGKPPTSKHLVETKVRVRHEKRNQTLQRLKDEEREDLLPAVKWLYEQQTDISFFYRPAGRLQARDTSVFPIRAIETWPGWLRTDLFGPTVDIENAFCQFVLHHLERKHSTNEQLLKLKYPDIIRASYDKTNFREELCREVLHLPINDENISVVKKLIMALANGSNASAGMMTSDSRSQAVGLVKQHSPMLLPSEMIRAGDRLNHIAKQFRNAKRELCIYFGWKPTRENMKKIFQEYFNWEKDARYKIWDAVGFTGISAHDGLDGITVDDPEQLKTELFEKYKLRVSIENMEINHDRHSKIFDIA